MLQHAEGERMWGCTRPTGERTIAARYGVVERERSWLRRTKSQMAGSHVLENVLRRLATLAG
jgi:hypothetical protein